MLIIMVNVIKFGGSLSYKNDDSLNEERLSRLFKAFSKSYGKDIIYVIGGGKKCHDIGAEYKVNDYLGVNYFGKNRNLELSRRLEGFFLLQNEMHARLKKLEKITGIKSVEISEVLVRETLGDNENHEIAWHNEEVLKVRPLLTGSGAVLDRNILVCAISSDTVAAYIAMVLRADNLFIATDTNGVLDERKKTIPTFSVRDYNKFYYVNGEMRDKIRRVRHAVNVGIPTYIFNGTLQISKASELLENGRYTSLKK